MAVRQRRLLIACVAAVIITDQATKWWAWRNYDRTVINSGGLIFLGTVIRSWFAAPVTGAVADIAGGIAIVVGIRQLLLRRRSTAVLVGGALFAAGWISNIADRLGLRHWSAPGSARGVVDFIPSGGTSRCNVADLWIVIGAALLAYAFTRRVRAKPRGTDGDAYLTGNSAHRWPVRVAVLITLLAIVSLAILNGTDTGGVWSPREHRQSEGRATQSASADSVSAFSATFSCTRDRSARRFLGCPIGAVAGQGRTPAVS